AARDFGRLPVLGILVFGPIIHRSSVPVRSVPILQADLLQSHSVDRGTIAAIAVHRDVDASCRAVQRAMLVACVSRAWTMRSTRRPTFATSPPRRCVTPIRTTTIWRLGTTTTN